MTGSIKRKSEHSWQLIVELPKLNGKLRQKYVTVVGGKRDAQRELTKLLASLADNEYSDPKKTTVADLVTRYVEHEPRELSTQRRYRGIAAKQILPVLGTVPLAKLSPVHVETAISAWRSLDRQDRKGGTISGTTQKHAYDLLRAACRYGVRMRLLSYDPCGPASAPKKVKARVKAAGSEQAMALWEGLADTTLAVPTIVAFGTGLRRGEFLALHRQDVDLEKLRGVLDDPLWPNSPYLFPDPLSGRAWKPDVFSSAVYYRVRALKLPELSVQGLRHSFATVMLRVGIKTVSGTRNHDDRADRGHLLACPRQHAIRSGRQGRRRHVRYPRETSRSLGLQSTGVLELVYRHLRFQLDRRLRFIDEGTEDVVSAIRILPLNGKGSGVSHMRARIGKE